MTSSPLSFRLKRRVPDTVGTRSEMEESLPFNPPFTFLLRDPSTSLRSARDDILLLVIPTESRRSHPSFLLSFRPSSDEVGTSGGISSLRCNFIVRLQKDPSTTLRSARDDKKGDAKSLGVTFVYLVIPAEVEESLKRNLHHSPSCQTCNTNT